MLAEEVGVLTLVPTLSDEEENAPIPAQLDLTGQMSSFRTFVAEYFYFSMALLFIAIKLIAVVQTSGAAASYVEGDTPIHPAAARPLILWVHNMVFNAWLVFFLFQSALVRAHRVRSGIASWAGLAVPDWD